MLGALRQRRVHRSDRGAFLLIFAISLTVVVLTVAFLVDLGQARFSKRAEQSAADLAALDAGYFLSGRGSAGSPISEPAKACIGAAQSVIRNVPDFRPAPTDAAITAACNANMPTTIAGCSSTSPVPKQAQFVAGEYVLTIRYPIPDSELDTAGFSGGGVDDGADPCERMRVTLQKTEGTAFAQVIDADQLSTVADAVIRANTSSTIGAVAALLLLERVGCEGLQTSGGGSTGSGVVVQSSANDMPGIIAADSAGQVPPCTTNNNPGGWVIYGTALPAAGGGGPSITSEDAPNGTEGIISIYALSVGGRGGYHYSDTPPTGLSVAPTAGTINSRQIADDRFLGVDNQIGKLHNAARIATATVPSSPDWNIVTGSECNGTVDPADLLATQVFVDCDEFSPDQNLFLNATDFVVRGKIDIANGAVLSLPVVQNFYVRGCVSGCNGGGNFAVNVANGGSLLVNTGETVVPGSVTCDARNGPGAGGTVMNTTKFATLGGRVDVAGLFRLCQTTLYVGDDPDTSYDGLDDRHTLTSGGPAIAQCSVTLPCPKDDAIEDSYIVFAPSGDADWSAPNQLDTRPESTDLMYSANPFEDLALWSESSTASSIRGQGNNSTKGIFFLPNAYFTFSGQGTQSQPLNAQFFVRRMNVSGQGSLFMKPNPADALDVDVPGNIALIR